MAFQDPWLKPYAPIMHRRYLRYREICERIDQYEGGWDNFTRGYEKFGFNVVPGGIIYREWAPNAVSASLVGDFNNWDRNANPMNKGGNNAWETFVPNRPDGSLAIPHNSRVKISMTTPEGEVIDRLPAWIRRAVPESDVNSTYSAVFWHPEKPYEWRNAAPPKPENLKIYEAHVGISSPEPKIASYKEFTENVLPHIARLGYNSIQLMGIMEHAYYASFGYQVTNFFAVSSRFGTPEDLKQLIDTAHGLGLYVLLDIVHSHASSNISDGLNKFDGTDQCYFHSGERGFHPIWNSRLFNYGELEVQRFLLSNVRFYAAEYHFDGFRFDAVTSIMFHHHGIGVGFTGNYAEYFNEHTDDDGVLFLMMANAMLHHIFPNIITIAEDVSGMPGLCRDIEEGGIGFDQRLAMAIPEMWVKLLREYPVPKDESWNMGYIVHNLTNRRDLEKTISYCESHDQALVGSKTIVSWLMEQEMYQNMSIHSPMTTVIDRGLSLHKMIRLITQGLGGEGYLNFEGNEFGHPEWLDFPREGNNYSYHYARRQFNLALDELLRYSKLNEFDRCMNLAEQQYNWLKSPQAWIYLAHEDDKVIAFERGGLLWIFNFHPTKSHVDYQVGTGSAGSYKIVLNTDDAKFEGHNRVEPDQVYFSLPGERHGRPQHIQVYIPTRTALVLALRQE
ncbi:glycogen branching enzyme [Basidiobolus meristosporus CBS 931.73]|uniref:1,4-alpha-glucan-branching enzyme n=1 Tax=Basidiobolus meristosporus CBS 931.73 TaxID=1314790 RepID=A0A1Y1Z3B1_9FUNG|nr:glycogen branching enzyme [Basidiobolus meristosporus CBS 931.73]|eukprot:ORY04604.1 glycogen branching enzyme [Basidiobolus meristosporus CBS 931.73]